MPPQVHENASKAMEECDPEAPDIEVQTTTDICDDTVQIKFGSNTLELSLVLEEDQLQPLFSGAAWAGTVVWDSAIELAKYVLTKYSRTQLEASDIVELGAGIGVPGMLMKLAGARKVIVTEQPSLLPLLQQNIAANFTQEEAIVGQELDWGHATTQAFSKVHPHVELILCCDCVYEPLYGDSWRLLLTTITTLLTTSPKAIVLVSVERRNEDGIDKFLDYITHETPLVCELVKSTLGTSGGTIEIYHLGS